MVIFISLFFPFLIAAVKLTIISLVLDDALRKQPSTASTPFTSSASFTNLFKFMLLPFAYNITLVHSPKLGITVYISTESHFYVPSSKT